MADSKSLAKTCFVIAPIGDVDSETRRRGDVVFRHIIEPCAAECGYTAVRADQIAEPGLITTQIITHLIEDPLVIADLTERNPNVFYELAIRHVLRKPVVQILQQGDSIPFDVAGMRTIQIDHRDLDSVAVARQEIVRQIRFLDNEPSRVESPISATFNIEHLRRSDKPEERLIADMTSSLDELRSAIAGLAREQQSMIEVLLFKVFGRTESEADPPRVKTAKKKMRTLETAARRLQGRYLSLIRQIAVEHRGKYVKIANERGREAAIREMEVALGMDGARE